MKKVLCCLLAVLLGGLSLATSAYAELSKGDGSQVPATITVPQEQVDTLAALLEKADPATDLTFNIINATGTEEALSTDITSGPLQVTAGVAALSKEDVAALDAFVKENGLTDATDAEKIAAAVAWIHNHLQYNAIHSGSYVNACFVDAGGQCNIYNGALCAFFTYLGYKAQLVRGYRANTGNISAHWWVELVVDKVPYVFESGNLEDGEWYYLGSTYAQTHGGDRDYIKCQKYAWNEEPYDYKGVAVCNRTYQTAKNGDTIVSAYIQKGESYAVSEVGCYFGPDAGHMVKMASEEVPAAYNAVNEGSGFMVHYDLSKLTEDKIESGMPYYFYAIAGGKTFLGPIHTIGEDDPPEEAQPVPTPTVWATPLPTPPTPQAQGMDALRWSLVLSQAVCVLPMVALGLARHWPRKKRR